MRNVQVLLLPFFCEGYDESAASQQVKTATEQLSKLQMDVCCAPLIRTVADAEQAARDYNPYLYDVAIALITTWSEPRLPCVALRQFFGKPIAIWCQDAFMYEGRRIEMSAAPASAALRGCLQEMGVPCELYVGIPFTQSNADKFTALCSAARAISLMRNAKLGFFGHNFNGITAADFDLSLLRKWLGTEVYAFDCSELIKRMEQIDAQSDDYAAMEKRVAERVVGNTGEHFHRIVRMCLALKNYVCEFGLEGLNVRCHTELSQSYGLSACLPLAILGEDVTCSCEADIPVMLSQMILHYLSGGKTSAYVDLRTFGSDGMDVGACGFAPCALTGGKAEVSGPEAPGNGNPSGYLTSKSSFDCGRITMARLLKFPGGVLKLHWSGASAQTMESALQEMGCPYYPMTKVVPDISVERFMEYVGANHYALVYDELAASLAFFCKYTGIEMVQ